MCYIDNRLFNVTNYFINAENEVFGRLASKIVKFIIGKNKSYYIDNVNIGDKIHVYNIDKIIFTGNKFNNKKYFRHSGYPGGLKTFILKDLFLKDSCKFFKFSVKKMLPKNSLSKIMCNNLSVYCGDKYNYFMELKYVFLKI